MPPLPPRYFDQPSIILGRVSRQPRAFETPGSSKIQLGEDPPPSPVLWSDQPHTPGGSVQPWAKTGSPPSRIQATPACCGSLSSFRGLSCHGGGFPPHRSHVLGFFSKRAEGEGGNEGEGPCGTLPIFSRRWLSCEWRQF